MERLIIIGLITSTDFIKQIRTALHLEYIESHAASTLATWCFEYFDEFSRAPGKDIELIYYEKLRLGQIPKEVAVELEEDILPGLSEEYENTGTDVDVLLKKTYIYIQERSLVHLRNTVDFLIEKGELDSAEKIVQDFKVTTEKKQALLLNSEEGIDRIIESLVETAKPLIKFHGPLGEMWNSQFTRGSFIGFLAPEKRGKSIILMNIAVKARLQGLDVAYILAGDMSESQALRRLAINITKKPRNPQYVGERLIAVKDCVKNQLNLCDKPVRECDFGIFEDRGWNEVSLRKEVTYEELLEAYKDEPAYKHCFNCEEYLTKPWGVTYLEKRNFIELKVKDAKNTLTRHFKKGGELRISAHANNTLTMAEFQKILDTWEMHDNWVPDVIIVDYADLLEADKAMEERQRQNYIWSRLRSINLKTNCLMITATQADADSYERDLLTLKNYSEDKRKYGHVTAMYGLNLDKDGREKKLNIMRINEILLREAEYDTKSCVTVLQTLFLYDGIRDSYL